MTPAPTRLVVVRNTKSEALMPSRVYEREVKDRAHRHGNHIYLVLIGPRIRVASVTEEGSAWKFGLEWFEADAWHPRVVRIPQEALPPGVFSVHSGHAVHLASGGTATKYAAVELARIALTEAERGERSRSDWHRRTVEKFFSLTVAYVGQAYGKQGSRTVVERIEEGHEHLQKVLADINDFAADRQVSLMMIDHAVAGAEMSFSIDPENAQEIAQQVAAMLSEPAGPLHEGKPPVDAVEAMLIRYFQPEENERLKEFPVRDAPALVASLTDQGITHLGVELDVRGSYCVLWDERRQTKAAHHRFAVNLRTGEPETGSSAPLAWQA